MGIRYKIPVELMKQDPATLDYKLGSIEMNPAQYSMAIALNEIKDEINEIKERLIKVEGK